MKKPTCRWPECDRVKILARGLCSKHYARERSSGVHDAPLCLWLDCGRTAMRRGFCHRDYKRAEKRDNFIKPWAEWQDTRYRQSPYVSCRWPDCERLGDEAHGLCKRHWFRGRDLNDMDRPWESWGNNICLGCGETFTGRNKRQKHCSDVCALAAWKQVHPERLRELGRRSSRHRRALILGTQAERFTETDVRQMYGDECYLCGKTIDYAIRWPHPQSPSLDHVIPLARGGTHTLNNVAMTHWACNNKKSVNVALATPVAIVPTQ